MSTHPVISQHNYILYSQSYFLSIRSYIYLHNDANYTQTDVNKIIISTHLDSVIALQVPRKFYF